MSLALTSCILPSLSSPPSHNASLLLLPYFRFSVLRESSGAISTVLFPPPESPSVLAFKKALATLLSTDSVFSEREEDGSYIWEWVEGGSDGVKEGGGGGREKSVRKVMSLDEMGAIVQVKVEEKISPPEKPRRTGISVWSGLLFSRKVYYHIFNNEYITLLKI